MTELDPEFLELEDVLELHADSIARYGGDLDRSLGAYAIERQIDYLLDVDGAVDFAKPYWDGGRPISFRGSLWPTEGLQACRRIVLVPLRPRETNTVERQLTCP